VRGVHLVALFLANVLSALLLSLIFIPFMGIDVIYFGTLQPFNKTIKVLKTF